MTDRAIAGEYLENGTDEERWTCPDCYHDHRQRVTTCEKCGIGLRCEKRETFVARCTVTAPDGSIPDDE
jgi:hypothetical protein